MNVMDQILLEKIKKMANDERWETRETAGTLIKKINDKHFKEYFPIWKKWVRDPNPNIRRAVEVGLLRIKKEYVADALELIEPLLYDDNVYVRKNCGPYALSHICHKNAELAFKKLEKWISINDVNVRWNIAMCLGVWFGTSNPEKSIKILKILAQDEQRFVWRAAASSIIKLLRRYPKYKKEVYAWENVDHVLNVVKRYV